jgi:hypothetical protein
MIGHNTSANTHFSKTVAAAGLAMAILLGLADLAAAQSDTRAASGRSGATAETTGQGSRMPPASESPMRAPVGHFQPSPRDTPGLVNEDISRTPDQIELDKNLRICRGC